MKSRFSSGKTFKTKLISYAFLPMLALLLISCGKDNPSSVEEITGDCGPQRRGGMHRVASQYTRAIISGQIRTFQYSLLGDPPVAITNVCTKSHAVGSGTASFNSDIARPLTFKLHILIGVTVYQFLGTKSANSWTTGSRSFGLAGQYGEGPGQIDDFRVDVSFPTFGNFSVDEDYIYDLALNISANVVFDEYRPPPPGLIFKPERTNSFDIVSSLLSGRFTIGEKKVLTGNNFIVNKH